MTFNKSLDPWLTSLDWSLKKQKLRSSKSSLDRDFDLTKNAFYKLLPEHDRVKIDDMTFSSLSNQIFATSEFLPKNTSHLINYPK